MRVVRTAIPALLLGFLLTPAGAAPNSRYEVAGSAIRVIASGGGLFRTSPEAARIKAPYWRND